MKRWNDNLVFTVPIFLYLFDFIVFNVIIRFPVGRFKYNYIINSNTDRILHL